MSTLTDLVMDVPAMLDDDLRVDADEAIAEQAKVMRAHYEANGISEPDIAALFERVKQYDQRLAIDVDAAFGALMALWGIAGYVTGYRAGIDAPKGE